MDKGVVGMKKLSESVSKEVWIKPSYAIARFMKSKKAFKTEQDQPMICTGKFIKEVNVPIQLQLHLRFDCKDHYDGEKEVFDLDLYIPVDEVEGIVNLFNEFKRDKKQRKMGDW